MRKHILLSNDDGYSARGIEALYEALSDIADVTVVAPETNHSGASNSLTLNRPLAIRQAKNGFYYVNGTPSDSVHVALTGLVDKKIDLVVAGINNGANLGEDTVYSGPVAAVPMPDADHGRGYGQRHPSGGPIPYLQAVLPQPVFQGHPGHRFGSAAGEINH